MNRAIVLCILIVSLSACVTTTERKPTPGAPATPPVGPSGLTSVATKILPPNSGIAVKDMQRVTRADGTVNTTASVTTQDNLGLGQLEMNYPDSMLVSDTRRIVLRITPAKQLTASTPVAAPSKAPTTPTLVYVFGGNLQLYPVMIAQLRALAFDIDLPNPVRRNVDGTKEIQWDWLVRARAPGRHDLSIEVSIPVIRDGVTTEITTDVLQNVPLVIQVQAAPVPTPTTVPILTRIGDSIISNAGAIAVALIGLLGTVIGIWLKARSDQAKAASESAPKKSQK